MKDISHPKDMDKTYWHRDHLVTRCWIDGMYSCHTRDGVLKADTQAGIKRLLNESIARGKGDPTPISLGSIKL